MLIQVDELVARISDELWDTNHVDSKLITKWTLTKVEISWPDFQIRLEELRLWLGTRFPELPYIYLGNFKDQILAEYNSHLSPRETMRLLLPEMLKKSGSNISAPLYTQGELF